MDGATALDKIRHHPSDQPLLVVLDEMMPLMSGIDVLKCIRADPAIANTPVIMHTAGLNLSKREMAMTLAAAAWLFKGDEAVLKEIISCYERIGGTKEHTPPHLDKHQSHKPGRDAHL
jgi:CheY-like chemotaxis protein